MKNSICIFGGVCTEKYLYMIYRGNSLLQVEKKTGIATDIIELEKEQTCFMEYLHIYCHDKKIFVCPFLGDKLAVYEEGDVFHYNLGLGDSMQIVAVTLIQDELVMQSKKTEGFISFDIKTHKINEIKIEHGFCEDPTTSKMNEIFWTIDRKGQVIENDQGNLSILYQGDQKLKKYQRDNTGEYFICLNGEVWKRSGNVSNKLITIPDIGCYGCYNMDGILYIVYFDRNLIYVISEKQVNKLEDDDCKYWTNEDGDVIIPTVMPDKYHGGLYLYTNYQHKIIYLGLHGEIIEKPIYVRKQKPEMFMYETRSDDLQSYLEAGGGVSKDRGVGTLEEWITKI